MGCNFSFTANYLENWKSIATLKNDGTVAEKNTVMSSSYGSSGGTSVESANTARYLKLGNVAQASHVVWH